MQMLLVALQRKGLSFELSEYKVPCLHGAWTGDEAVQNALPTAAVYPAWLLEADQQPGCSQRMGCEIMWCVLVGQVRMPTELDGG